MEVLGPILNFLLPVLGTVITLFLVALAKKYIGKLGIERSVQVDAMIDKYVGLGVDSAEKLAANFLKANPDGVVTGSSKKANAVNVVLAELEQSGIKGVAEELISARIEALLESKPGKSSGTA